MHLVPTPLRLRLNSISLNRLSVLFICITFTCIRPVFKFNYRKRYASKCFFCVCKLFICLRSVCFSISAFGYYPSVLYSCHWNLNWICFCMLILELLQNWDKKKVLHKRLYCTLIVFTKNKSQLYIIFLRL